MSSHNDKVQPNHEPEESADFHGAAIIDSEGQEVPITEEMVKKACEELEKNRKKS